MLRLARGWESRGKRIGRVEKIGRVGRRGKDQMGERFILGFPW
jgi:hypothetical protein